MARLQLAGTRLALAALALAGCGTRVPPPPASELVLDLDVGASDAMSGDRVDPQTGELLPPQEPIALTRENFDAGAFTAENIGADRRDASSAASLARDPATGELTTGQHVDSSEIAAAIAEANQQPLLPGGAPALPEDWSPPPWPEDAPPLQKMLYAGSWEPDGPEGFDEAWIDEAGLREAFTMEQAGRRQWRGSRSAADELPLDNLVQDRDGPAVAYVYALLSRTSQGDDPWAEGAYQDEPAVLHVRHRGRIRARIDGRIVMDEPAPPAGEWAEASALVLLTDPYDVLLLKCGRGSDELGASMDCEVRVSTLDGTAIEGQAWNTMRPPGTPSDLP